MQKNLLLSLALGLVLLVDAALSLAGELYYVQPSSAKILAGASFGAEVLGVVASGHQFELTGRQGIWLKLNFNGKSGYIPAVQAVNYPPLPKKLQQQGGEAPPKLTGRARASSTSVVVAGVKGLTYEDRARTSGAEKVNYDALDKVDSLKITPEELNTFVAGGGKP